VRQEGVGRGGEGKRGEEEKGMMFVAKMSASPCKKKCFESSFGVIQD
jgi:hypothetical protein